MAISFVSPSYRAASSDLTIAISPLGLVELADEEFEVHGPRLNRYASNWAKRLLPRASLVVSSRDRRTTADVQLVSGV